MAALVAPVPDNSKFLIRGMPIHRGAVRAHVKAARAQLEAVRPRCGVAISANDRGHVVQAEDLTSAKQATVPDSECVGMGQWDNTRKQR